MECYQYVQFLGQGSYGEVQLVKHIVEEKEVTSRKQNIENCKIV